MAIIGVIAVGITVAVVASGEPGRPRRGKHTGPTDAAARPIFEITSKFVDALDEQDVGKLADTMCSDDRDAYLDYHPQADVDRGGIENPQYEDVLVEDIEIRGRDCCRVG